MRTDGIAASSQASSRDSLATLQAGRGAAALLVVLYHLSGGKYWGADPARNAFAFGYSGVHFFFVLSGFIIYFIHSQDLGIAARLRRYALKRFVRIYPIYWLVLFAVLFLYFMVPSLGTGIDRSSATVISSIALLHFDALSPRAWMSCQVEAAHTVLGVAWSLYHEILFYLLFALAIWRRTTGIAAMTGWFLLSALSLLLNDRNCLITFFFTPLHLLFAMGIGASWAVQNRLVRFPGACAVAGIALFLATGLIEDNGGRWIATNVNTALYGASSMLAIMGFVVLEREGKVRISALPRLLGDASYSIYLVHFPLLSLFANVLMTMGARRWSYPSVAFAIIFVMVVSVGVAVHLVLEKRLLKLCNKYLLPGRADAPQQIHLARTDANNV